MDEQVLCAECGSPVSHSDLTSGHCPHCLVELGCESTSPLPDLPPGFAATSSREAVIGGYTILRLIGEGGMGTVYEAEQHHPRRLVAVKIIKAGRAGAESLRRFEQEAHALGRLQHPNIARIYEAGMADTGLGPQPYFAMEFVRGRSPLDYAEAHQLKIRDRLELVARIADAVHHAHQRGLIHRDLKPANILVDDDGQPKVLDFGVARVSDSAEPAQTNAGQLVGTLAYMSPEQVSGDPLEIDTRTDVYALGLILYELLAGRRPYEIGRTLHEAVRTIRESEPAPLGAIDRACRGDVETIAAKSLEKDKSRRYGSAAELAGDIRRYLRHEPVIARPPSTTYQLQKFARRHRAIVIGVAATFVALVAGVIVSSLQTARAQRAEHSAVVERDRAREAERLAAVAEAGARTQRDLAERAEQLAQADRNRAVGAEDRARYDRDTLLWQSLARQSMEDSASRIDDDRAAMLARVALLVHGRTAGQPRSVVEEALQRANRGDPWSHTLFHSTGQVDSVSISRDDYLACACGDPVVRVWDLRRPAAAPLQLAGHERPVVAVAFSTDGARLAAGGMDGAILVWNLRNLRASPVRLRHPGLIHAVAFSPDGTRLASSNGSNVVHVWDLRNSASLSETLNHRSVVTTVAFSPDGRSLAAGGFGLYLWTLDDLDALPVILRDDKTLVSAVAFSPDGKRVMSGENWGVQIWEVAHTYLPPRTLSDRRSGGISALAVAPDGWQVAAGAFRNVAVWDSRTPAAPPIFLEGYGSQITSVSFSPDARYLATGSVDKTLRVWDLRREDVSVQLSPGSIDPAPRWTQALQGAAFSGLAFSPDGSRLAAGGDDPNVRVWNVRQAEAGPIVLRGHEEAILTVAFSPDGTRVVAGGSSTIPQSRSPMVSSAEGRRLAFGGNGLVRLWSLNNPTAPPLQFSGHRDAILAVGFSSKDPRVWSASSDGTLRAWDPRDRRSSSVVVNERIDAREAEEYKRRLFARSQRIGDGDDEGVRLIRAITSIEKRQSSFFTAAISPDHGRLATVSEDRRTVRVWDLTNRGAAPLFLEGRTFAIASVAFSPNGTYLAVTGVNPNVQIWDLRDPSRAPVSQGQDNVITSAVAFSPDSLRVAFAPAGGPGDRGVQVWEWRNPAKAPLRLPGRAPTAHDSLAFSPDGRHLAALERGSGRITMWKLWSEAADYLCGRVWRNLSMHEWRLYVGDSRPYEPVCSGIQENVPALQVLDIGRSRPTTPVTSSGSTSHRPDTPVSPSGMSIGGAAGCPHSGLRITGSRLTITAPLASLIAIAFGDRTNDCRMPNWLVGGPDWIRTDVYDIVATVPADLPADTALRLANRDAPAVQAILQALLTEHFNVKVHRETVGVDGYALTSTARTTLTPATKDDVGSRSIRTLTRRLDATGRPFGDLVAGQASMADLAAMLKGIVGSPVEDRTAVTGRFYFTLEFDQAGLARPTLAAALQRLGLDLKPANVPMPVLVIDRAERPSGR